MRDISRKIEIDGQSYDVERTFDGSPGVYQEANEKFIYANINSSSKNKGFHILSLLEGHRDEDCVIIFARKSKEGDSSDTDI
ncbi:hypothetical protein ACFVS2_20380 [Brevibacillus sp. NPDC058079]|uniref:hypothetical protein n=1 Tax=Brevibacillus sp. NPDC058079 TaxID=3346330 RepID=UPI0036ED6112